MKTLILSLIITLAGLTMVSAAPVDSVASSRATSARQQIDTYLNQDAVSAHLAELGLSRATIDQRLAKLDDAQLTALATEIELVQAGGEIQGTHISGQSVFACIFKPLGRFIYNVYQVLFCWGNLT